jgi:hypothetical protein
LEKLCRHFLDLEKLETGVLGKEREFLVPERDHSISKLHVNRCGALGLEILGELAQRRVLANAGSEWDIWFGLKNFELRLRFAQALPVSPRASLDPEVVAAAVFQFGHRVH